jgi:hypothetical protein
VYGGLRGPDDASDLHGEHRGRAGARGVAHTVGQRHGGAVRWRQSANGPRLQTTCGAAPSSRQFASPVRDAPNGATTPRLPACRIK